MAPVAATGAIASAASQGRKPRAEVSARRFRMDGDSFSFVDGSTLCQANECGALTRRTQDPHLNRRPTT
jgi:hypothetical protein